MTPFQRTRAEPFPRGRCNLWRENALMSDSDLVNVEAPIAR
jgi:hypothetical protein